MAFNTTQTSVILEGGNTPALVWVTGTYACDGGTTGGVISPGYNNAAGTFTAASNGGSGCTQIVGPVLFTPTASDATAPGGVKAFNATRSRDEFTLVCTANSTGTYGMYCLNNGSQP